MPRIHATPVVFAIYPEPGAPWPGFYPMERENASVLDSFYIDAHRGIDHETGEIVDKPRYLAADRDFFAYDPPIRF